MKRSLLFLLLLWPGMGQAQTRYLIDDVADIQIHGARGFDEIGRYPIGSGDYNGDGIADCIIGTDLSICPECLKYAHVVFGATNLPEDIDLYESRLGISERQVLITGFSFFVPVASLGDFNGDGYDDMFFGDDDADLGELTNAGQAFIKYGGPSIPHRFDLYDATMEGVRIMGSRFWGWLSAERSIGNAGDINGDGFADALLGAPSYASVDPYREAFIIYGGTDVPSELWTHDLGHHGVRIVATDPGETFGYSMDGVGDVNGDGLNDIVIGSEGAFEEQGYAYLIFGATDLPDQLETEALGSRGVRIKGAGPGDLFGLNISAAGDVNRDGFADFMVSSIGSDPGGKVYLVFGTPQWPEYLDADEMGNGGVIIAGSEGLNSVGISAVDVGDADGDGYDDILVGARDQRISIKQRQVSIVFGGGNLTNRLRGVLDEYDQLIIETFTGSDEWFNASAVLLGDINGDGIRDIAIGAPFASPYDRGGAGTVYVIYGGKFLPGSADLNSDGAVNYSDLFLFQSQWMKESD